MCPAKGEILYWSTLGDAYLQMVICDFAVNFFCQETTFPSWATAAALSRHLTDFSLYSSAEWRLTVSWKVFFWIGLPGDSVYAVGDDLLRAVYMQLPLLQLLRIISVPLVSCGSSYDSISCNKTNFPHQHLIFLSESLWDFSFTCRNWQQSYVFSFPTSPHSSNFCLQAPFSLSHISFKALISFHHFRFILEFLSLTFYYLLYDYLVLRFQWISVLWLRYWVRLSGLYFHFCHKVSLQSSVFQWPSIKVRKQCSYFQTLCEAYSTNDCDEIIGWQWSAIISLLSWLSWFFQAFHDH